MSYQIWVSGRHPDGRTFTVGGESFDQFFTNATDLFGPDAAQRLSEDFGVLVDPPSPTPSQQQAPSARPSAPAPGAPVCDHGPRRYKESFTSKAGKAMPSSWQCTSGDRASQCKAVWNDN